jgi:hypothetical protein
MNMYVNRCWNLKRQKCDQERSREDSKIKKALTREIHGM